MILQLLQEQNRKVAESIAHYKINKVKKMCNSLKTNAHQFYSDAEFIVNDQILTIKRLRLLQ